MSKGCGFVTWGRYIIRSHNASKGRTERTVEGSRVCVASEHFRRKLGFGFGFGYGHGWSRMDSFDLELDSGWIFLPFIIAVEF